MGHKKRNVAPSRSSKASGAPPPSPVISNGGGGGSVSDGVVSSVETEQNNTNSNSSIEIQQQQQQQQQQEKFRLIPIRRVSEDPMEVRLVQARRPNEIKKATKTPEERRKEIEVRVAAARLLQQKSEAPQSQNDENKALDSSSGSGQRAAERRKSGNLRKNASSAERRDWLKPQASELLGESYQRNYAEECKDCLTNNDCSEDAWDLSPQREKFGDSCNGDIVECKSYDKVSDIRWRECDVSHAEAESLNANQLGFEETYGGVTNQLCDLESGEDDDWRMKDYLHQVDSCIEVAIQRQKEQLATELSKLDAKMMRNLTGMQQMEAKLDPVSALDYRLILVPLVKSFMRARLEDLAEKDATEKSDAAREAFLAELALDSKKGTGGGGDNSRNVQEKTRDKKKNKENRKTKDLKATGTDELVLHHETTEQGSFPVASDVDYPDSEIVLSVSGDALKQQEEEIRRRIELEAEERKLEETLEYQRRIEEEAKQKHLAEQNKKTTTTIPDKHSDDDQDRHEQLKHCKKEPLTQQNGFPNVLEGALVNAADRSVQRIGNTHGHLHTYVKQGLPNGGISEDGALSSDRRTGRKGRRQRSSSKLVDAKYQAVSSEKENIEAGQVSRNGLHGDSNNPCVGDNGTKTLRQLRAEEDDEERFQADIKKAVRQSLDTFQAHKKVPLISSSRMSQKISSDVDNLDVALNEVTLENVNGADVYGTGLKNEVGEYNCFLNVIIQVGFREFV
ncbi:hypothetical protein LOK49_LG04G01974 [Camellia lanceoleosa]|uniref:Uncharacterized protein n=1 Tax=Camellia lanceoleosa TaxID=1840588 RepID=A0ACC0I294_9ERIC|nr:hypothetical protein LOK49_LG04G01974 [Camellia lanceoleosa]